MEIPTPTDKYLDKKGAEKAVGNHMPPGQHIENQKGDIREVPMKRITPSGYPGDGGFPDSE